MKIRLLSNGEDWEGLYIDDKLVAEGHKITLDMVMGRIIPRPDFKKVFIEGYFEEWGNRCPETWQEEFNELEE